MPRGDIFIRLGEYGLDMLELVREDRGEFVFLAAIGLISVWAYVQTLGFLQTSAVVPQFMLYIVAASLMGIVVMKAYGDRIEARLGLSSATAGFDLGQDDSDAQTAGLYEIDAIGVTREMVWIGAFVLGVVYIGFFTVSIVFSLSYILINETSPIQRRIPLSILWTGVIIGFLYILFIRFLQVSSVWRLGFLP